MQSGSISIDILLLCRGPHSYLYRAETIVDSDEIMKAVKREIMVDTKTTVVLLWQRWPRPDLSFIERILNDSKLLLPFTSTESDNKNIGDAVFHDCKELYLVKSDIVWRDRDGYDKIVAMFDKLICTRRGMILVY